MNLGQYIFYRFLGLILQMFGAVLLVFLLLELIPYDPTVFFLINFRSSNAAERARLLAELRAQLGLDVPFYMQIYLFFKNLILDGSLGTSWGGGNDVMDLILMALPNTLITFGVAFLIYTPMAIIFGIISANNRGGTFDNIVRVMTTATYSIPSYILGLWVVVIFASTGLVPWGNKLPESIFGYLAISILPILVVVIIYTGFQFRLVRAHMLKILKEDYIRTARAKGLSERTVIYKHALRNALPFFITSVAVTFPIAFSGVAALEVVFQIPGVGLLMVQAANGFDWPILIGVTTIFTFINAIILGITDVMVEYLSPKLKFDQRFDHRR